MIPTLSGQNQFLLKKQPLIFKTLSFSTPSIGIQTCRITSTSKSLAQNHYLCQISEAKTQQIIFFYGQFDILLTLTENRDD
jgi:hypothetical protein